MKILFLRHGSTKGNLEKRYISKTDELLCNEGILQLRSLRLAPCEVLVCSPMLRCIQTAEILFPEQIALTVEGLLECDFGDFEFKNYTELSENEYYQKWINSNAKLPFPNGEDPSDFRSRCIKSFEHVIIENSDANSIAFVVHGGTIMSVLERFAVPHKDYFEWHCENGHGYICDWNGKDLEILEKI